jgi:protein transport protein SEC61 subunit gamma and related proteins
MKDKIKHLWVKFKSFCLECKRVLTVTKKPDKEEFITIVKAAGLGMIIIGMVGFIVQMLRTILFP